MHFCFKKDPSVTGLVKQEAEAVARSGSRTGPRIGNMIKESVRARPLNGRRSPSKHPSMRHGSSPLSSRPRSRRSRPASSDGSLPTYASESFTARESIVTAWGLPSQLRIRSGFYDASCETCFVIVPTGRTLGFPSSRGCRDRSRPPQAARSARPDAAPSSGSCCTSSRSRWGRRGLGLAT